MARSSTAEPASSLGPAARTPRRAAAPEDGLTSLCDESHHSGGSTVARPRLGGSEGCLQNRVHVADQAPQPGPSPLESTATLIRYVQQGDLSARERLVRRYFHALRRFAHGRLPARARDLSDTDDLVQVTLLKALNKMKQFVPEREGAFLAYLRKILVNTIRDIIREYNRRPKRAEWPDAIQDGAVSPLEAAIGREAMERYDKALAALPEGTREAVVLRLELGFTYAQIAETIGAPSEAAARMAVTRAVARLSREMQVLREG
ncbi:MAG TPA: sigma-70 family RNA polymerase sigma factor [Candidatus Eisenbacteria bacterium]|nr:sigma-70 family RNA polymerase sigma factor [Candidatus Eisenbacteria bacterium]